MRRQPLSIDPRDARATALIVAGKARLNPHNASLGLRARDRIVKPPRGR